jgi:hypothetical protein
LLKKAAAEKWDKQQGKGTNYKVRDEWKGGRDEMQGEPPPQPSLKGREN